MSTRPDKVIAHAQGCLVGALVGDAVGATLEFIGRRPTPLEIERALEMPGGGVWGLAPGQVTDDGELALALGRSLVGEVFYPTDKVASAYVRWVRSQPFDVGWATRAALDCGAEAASQTADSMMKRAASRNAASKANGALMRSSPLGVWSTRLSLESTVDVARIDSSLTHPNLTCQWANAAYVVAIRHLLLTNGDREGAFAAACGVVEAEALDEADEVLSWLTDARNAQLPACHPQAGFVRIGFTHAFHHLLRASSFDEALREVLAGGGDTDTNACIVGGLVGANLGLDGIGKSRRDAVIRCDTRLGKPRPRWLQTQDVLALAESLLPVKPFASTRYKPELPDDPVPLNLALSYPARCLSAIKLGHESQDQSDKWSVYYRDPWIQFWRPDRNGTFWAAIRLSVPENGEIHVIESWGWGAGIESDPSRWSDVFESLLSSLAGFDPKAFQYQLVRGRRERQGIRFEGTASSVAQVEEIMRQLKSEVEKAARKDAPHPPGPGEV